MGIVVDAASEVSNFQTADLEEPPPFGARQDTDYIRSLAMTNGEVIIPLDIDEVLGMATGGMLAA